MTDDGGSKGCVMTNVTSKHTKEWEGDGGVMENLGKLAEKSNQSVYINDTILCVAVAQ